MKFILLYVPFTVIEWLFGYDGNVNQVHRNRKSWESSGILSVGKEFIMTENSRK